MNAFKIAAVQAAPVFLDRSKTIDKVCDLIAQAAREGAKLVVFPESFIPAYPDWIWVLPPKENKMISDLYSEFLAHSMVIPDDTVKICRAAKLNKIHVAIGISERNAEASGTSMYNSLLYIDAEGGILGVHRKLVPTAAERLVWAQGNGSTLEVYDTPFGKLGGLICWENYMPLARYVMYAWGTQIYVAPTWDSGEPWLSTLRHIGKEGRVFVVGCCMALHRKDIPDRFEFKTLYAESKEWINVGDSAIVNPDGKIIAGPLNKKEDILYAEIDPAQMTGPRWKLDVAGHYARPYVFELSVNLAPAPLIRKNEIPDKKIVKNKE
jgi:nitrilase